MCLIMKLLQLESNIHEYDIFIIDLQEKRKEEYLSRNEEPNDTSY